jgi:ATP-dependent RNA helicase DDX46/PRP5/arginine/serine-rich splicing factor 12
MTKHIKSVGSRAKVMHGNAKHTSGGLRKKRLKYNKRGRIVSRKASRRAKKEKRLAGYPLFQSPKRKSRRKSRRKSPKRKSRRKSRRKSPKRKSRRKSPKRKSRRKSPKRKSRVRGGNAAIEAAKAASRARARRRRNKAALAMRHKKVSRRHKKRSANRKSHARVAKSKRLPPGLAHEAMKYM